MAVESPHPPPPNRCLVRSLVVRECDKTEYFASTLSRFLHSPKGKHLDLFYAKLYRAPAKSETIFDFDQFSGFCKLVLFGPSEVLNMAS